MARSRAKRCCGVSTRTTEVPTLACHGRGLATNVVMVLCRYGFSILGLNRLQIETLSDNVAMIAAAQKVGFVVEGTHRSASWVNGAFCDDMHLGLLASEWDPAT
jgi:RimJ/RimL family protein N-acetyltransferase